MDKDEKDREIERLKFVIETRAEAAYYEGQVKVKERRIAELEMVIRELVRAVRMVP